MRNIKLTIEYDGTNYAGWQRQNNPQSTIHNPQLKTIQGTIEKTLQKILQEKIRLIGSGRTDAGVHAQAQVANFKTNSSITMEKLQKSLNAVLPEGIVINKIEKVGPDFHSRFSAKSKLYRYTILNRFYPSALLRNTVYFYPYNLNVQLMRLEARCLLGKHDFKSFCASGSSAKDTARTIKNISIKKLPYCLLPNTYYPRQLPLIIINIESDGFLYNMARNIVGTLIEIGRGRFKKGDVKKILLAKDRRLAGSTAPARGLCLVKVNY